VDLASDYWSCGFCGNTCLAGWRCCDGRCTDIHGNDQNCGGCGYRCPTGKHCDGLFCRDAEGNL
jgi:hypothetical protein